MGYLLEHWHEVAYLLLAAIVVGIYIVHFLPVLHKSSLRKLVEAETILIVILVFVAIIAARVETVSHNVEVRTSMIGETLDEVLRAEGLARVQKIGSLEELFAELNAARFRSVRAIRLTRLRVVDPAELDMTTGQAQLWREGLDSWLQAAPGRVFYQVVGVPNEKVRAWFEGECAEGAGSANRALRSIETRSESPLLNYVIFDKSEVFIIASPLHGPLAATRVYHVQDPGFGEFMTSAFDELYGAATPCGAGQ